MKAPRALAFVARLAAMVTLAALALPAIASAMTATQAQEAAEGELQRTYGSAWLERVPSWSVPECEEPRAPGEYQCMAEFEHAGTWHSVDVSVSGSPTVVYQTEWVREWHPNSNRCDKPLIVAGYLSSNHDGCDALLLDQNFGLTPRRGGHTIRYTGFKQHLYFYGTGSALWPDFYGYTCQRSQGNYECANKFGDGFRWKPSPAPHKHKRSSARVGSPRS